jgi:hypothetical protein
MGSEPHFQGSVGDLVAVVADGLIPLVLCRRHLAKFWA